jgi:hypothetical protein
MSEEKRQNDVKSPMPKKEPVIPDPALLYPSQTKKGCELWANNVLREEVGVDIRNE